MPSKAALEAAYQAQLRKRIENEILPGSMTFKNDANLVQGIPDLLVLYYGKWAMLEVKRSANEVHQPNQDYYVDLFNSWAFAAFIYPENEEEVLNALQHALQDRRRRVARVS